MTKVNPALKYIQQKEEKSDYFHTSGYANTQSGDHVGAEGGEMSIAARNALEEKRKHVEKYTNSEIVQSIYSTRKAQQRYTPKRKRSDIDTGDNSVINRRDKATNEPGQHEMATREQRLERSKQLDQRQATGGSAPSPAPKAQLPWN